jgi:hypothetical protein
MSKKFHHFLVVAFFALAAACGPSPETDAALPQEIPQESPDEVVADNVDFWDFQEGLSEGWDASPGWEWVDGSARSEGGEQVLYTVQWWANFNLFTRMEFGPESVFELQFRANPEGAYQFLFESGAVILVDRAGEEMRELYTEATSIEQGWHDVHVLVESGFVRLEIDGERVIELEGLERVSPGALAFLHHGGGAFAIDFVEVHDFGGGEEELAEAGMEAQGPPLEGPPTVVIPYPPKAELIEFGPPDESFMVQVTGHPGAVEPGSFVSLANLQTTRVYFVMADEDGGFQTEIFSYPGSSIQVKHFDGEGMEEFRMGLEEIMAGGEVILESHNAGVGTILRTPDQVARETGEIAFVESGFFRPLDDAYWHFDGVIDVLNASLVDLHLQVRGTLVITSIDSLEEISFDELNPTMHVSLMRHFDAQGNHTAIRKYLVSDFLSPTGFPIFHGEIPWDTIASATELGDLREVSPNSLVVDVRIDVVNHERIPLPEGMYGLKIGVVGWEHIPLPPARGPTMRSGVTYGPGGFYSPLFELGSPEDPHMNWALLTDTLHEATRGTMAREDKERISLLTMISQQDETFIIPREDPRTGQPIAYRLEPFLPLIAYGDRGLPAPPTIDFAFPSGELWVAVTKPDGGTDILGPAPFMQAVNSTPSYDFGKVLDYSIGGGALQEVYQLTTLMDSFAYEFEQYGHYVIEMTGSIEDIDGNSYSGGGTYDVYVARPLKVYNGVLPSTPFVQGDRFSPSLQVYPRMPVEVDMRLTFLPDSSRERAVVIPYRGVANPYGYFYPPDHEPFVFQDGGEYRVDVLVRYTEETGALWMGSATWGNVVENQGTSLIAHGSRGLDHPEINNLWFFHQQLDVEGVHHTFFPFYSGDIFWGHDAPGDDSTVKGADAILPGVSLEDTEGQIGEILRSGWYSDAHALFDVPEGRYENAIEVGEIRPFSSTSSGLDLGLFPEQIVRFGYVYQSSERPDSRVHESLSEGVIPIGYWRYVGTYGAQVGVEGDLPNDLKWQFGGVVFRDEQRGIHEYASYGSLWVLLHDDDPIGARITPPFQGATGGPNGGPILTLKGEEIDLLFLSRSGFPGQILQVGDILSFSGFVGPPLDSKVTITATSPSGQRRVVAGRANHVGYFYDPQQDFVADVAGIWKIHIEVAHDGLTSSGPTMEPYPTGGVLGAAGGEYEIYVVDRAPAGFAELTTPLPGFLRIVQTPIPPIAFSGVVSPEFEGASYSYTIAMPGFILEQGEGRVEAGAFSFIYDPAALHETFPNLDVTAFDDLRPGLADQVWITALFEAEGGTLPLAATLHGEEVFHR